MKLSKSALAAPTWENFTVRSGFYEEINNILKNPLLTVKFSHVGAAKADLDSFMMEYKNLPESLDLSVE
jgi:hypothetical protein